MHKYHLVVQITVFFIIGIFLEFQFINDIKFIILASILCLSVLLYRNISSFAVALFFILLGMVISGIQINEFQSNPFFANTNHENTIKGLVNSDVVKKDNYYHFTLRANRLNSKKVNNLVKVYSKNAQVSFGDFVKFNGHVKISEIIKARNRDVLIFTNSNLKVEGKHPFWSPVGKLRQWVLNSILTEKNDASAFTLAMITGRISDLSYNAKQDLQASGLSHLWSVSGLHTGFLAAAILLILRILSIKAGWQLVVIVVTMVLFSAFTGFSPPVIRASIMVSWVAFAYLYGRLNNWLPAVSASALISLSINPSALFDPSFQLSYAAIISIFYFKEKVKSFLNDIPIKFREAIAVGVSAQIIPLPLIAFYFGEIPVFSLLANLLAIPIAAVVFNLSIIALFFKLIGFSSIIKIPIILSDFILKIASFLNSFELSTINVNYFALILILPVIFALFSILIRRKFEIKLIYLIMIFLSIFAISIWIPISNELINSNKLVVEYLDVGQGDSILINGPKNEKILIDSGRDQYTIMKHLSERKIKRLNLIIATHADSDHIGGLPLVLGSLKIDLIVGNGLKSNGFAYSKFKNLIRIKKIKYFAVKKGQNIKVGSLRFRVLAPKAGFIEGTESDDNNNSVIVKLSYYKHDFLFTGDAGFEEEKVLDKSKIDSEVLKVAHHGSASSTSSSFLKSVNAKYAIISVGKHNMYGHPKQNLLQRLKSAHVKIYRTDVSSTIKIIASKENLRIYD